MVKEFWRYSNMNEHEPSLFRYFEDGIGIRQSTLQEVLLGEMGPIERRAKIINHRRNLLFGRPDVGSSSSTIEIESNGANEDSEAETNEREQENEVDEKPAVMPLGAVEIAAESPTENEIRAANAVAQKHPDANKVVLADQIRVSQSPGTWFELEIRDVMEREFGIVDDTASPDRSTPSMSEAPKSS
jgi:hypothetical protein